MCFRELSCWRLRREDGVGGEPAAADIPQLSAVQLSWSQTLWKHSEEMADQSSPAPQPGQLRQETAQSQAEEDGWAWRSANNPNQTVSVRKDPSQAAALLVPLLPLFMLLLQRQFEHKFPKKESRLNEREKMKAFFCSFFLLLGKKSHEFLFTCE